MKLMHITFGYNESGVSAGLRCLAQHGFYENFDDVRLVALTKGDPEIRTKFESALGATRVSSINDDGPFTGDDRAPEAKQRIRTRLSDFSPNALLLSTVDATIWGRQVAADFPDLKIATFEHGTYAHLPESRKQMLRATAHANHMIFGDARASIDVTKQTLYASTTADMPSYVVPLTLPVFGVPRLSEPVDTFKVLAFGRLATEKNFVELVHASAILAHEGYPFELTIGGTGKQHEELLRLTNELGIHNRVHFPGYVSDTALSRAESHIYIQPSLSEGLCLGFIEAAAAGMVVVGTDVGGMNDYGIHNENMIKIHGFDRHAIADALRCAFDVYPQQATYLSQNALNMAAEHFSEPVVKQAWKTAADALKELCADQPSRTAPTIEARQKANG